MVAAIVVVVLVMMVAARPVSEFVGHPTARMLALSFLVLISTVLSRAPRPAHPKGYIYFAMAYAVAVEMLNLRLRQRRAERAQP